jgi:hypothetical protein
MAWVDHLTRIFFADPSMPEYSNLLQIDASAVRLQIVSKTVAARSHERSFAVVDGQLKTRKTRWLSQVHVETMDRGSASE